MLFPHKEAGQIKLLLHYKDHTFEKLDLTYQSDFSKLKNIRAIRVSSATTKINLQNQFNRQ